MKRRDEPEIWMPQAWPLFWRRAFLVTLPMSGPIWFSGVLVCGLLTMTLCACFIPFWLLAGLKESIWDRRPNERYHRETT